MVLFMGKKPKHVTTNSHSYSDVMGMGNGQGEKFGAVVKQTKESPGGRIIPPYV